MKALYKKYERYLVPAFLLGGFVVDILTFKYVEVRTVFTVLVVYSVIAGCAMLFLHNRGAFQLALRNKVIHYVRLLAPLVLQFTFGALLSASLIFYWYSGALSVSWPIIILVAALAIGNEAFRDYYLRPIVQIPIFYFAIFSLSSLILPFVLNSIDPWIFYASGILSMVIIVFYLKLFVRINNVKEHQVKYLTGSVLAIFVVINALYAFNIIPPIPLSIRDAGVYHGVTRSGGEYVLEAEIESIFERITPGQRIHVDESDSISVFTSIFAPADLNTRISHRWERFEPASREWVEKGSPSYSLVGGRQEGYRGYSFQIVTPGKWRVSVETPKGQTLGRVKFRVVDSENELELIEVTK